MSNNKNKNKNKNTNKTTYNRKPISNISPNQKLEKIEKDIDLNLKEVEDNQNTPVVNNTDPLINISNTNLESNETKESDNQANQDIDTVDSTTSVNSPVNTSKFKEDPNCKFDKAKDDKIKKIFSFSSIPFFIAGIVVSMFNMGSMRHPIAYLLIALALIIFSVPLYTRHVATKKCYCKNCKTQSRSSFQYFIMCVVAAAALIGVYLYYFFT